MKLRLFVLFIVAILLVSCSSTQDPIIITVIVPMEPTSTTQPSVTPTQETATWTPETGDKACNGEQLPNGMHHVNSNPCLFGQE